MAFVRGIASDSTPVGQRADGLWGWGGAKTEHIKLGSHLWIPTHFCWAKVCASSCMDGLFGEERLYVHSSFAYGYVMLD
jgi:hypothetical protein